MNAAPQGRARLAAAALAALLAACAPQDFAANRAVVDEYYAAVGANDLEGALRLYSSRFFAVTPRVDWQRDIAELRARCGGVRSHKLVNWNVVTTLGTQSGSHSILVYDVRYDQCRMTETFTVFRPEGGEPQILTQNLKASPDAPEAPGATATTTT